MDEANGAMPVQDDVVALLKQRGALRGCQIRQPKPRFCGRVLLNGLLPDENQLRYLCKDEPTARVQAVNHAWMGEGLGGLVDEAAMSDEQRRAALAHTCYIEITLEEEGAVPLELGKRFVRLLGAVSQASGCVGVDFGRTVLAAEEHIRNHLAEDLSLDALATRANLSPVYFHKLFRAHTHTTPAQYVLTTRIAAAKTMLKTGELSIGEIASRCGFSSQSYFNYKFKEVTGETPLQYRNTRLSRLKL